MRVCQQKNQNFIPSLIMNNVLGYYRILFGEFLIKITDP